MFHNGALDVWLTPILMKKNRPANTLSVLVSAADLTSTVKIIFSETSSIGLRYREVSRFEAQRYIKSIETPFGYVPVKFSFYQDKLINISAEYDNCKEIAVAQNIPLKTVQETVIAHAKQQVTKGVLQK